MKRNMYVSGIAVFVMLLWLTGCPSSFEEPVGPAPAAGKGFVVLQLGAGRTLLPATVTFAAYDLDFIAVDAFGVADSSRNDVNKSGAGPLDGVYELELGHWKLDVKLFSDAAGLILLASASGVDFEVISSSALPVVVPVYLLFAPVTTTGTGTLSYTITNNTGFTEDQAEIHLSPLGGGGSQAERYIHITSTLTGSRTDIGAGYYFVTVRLEHDLITPIPGRSYVDLGSGQGYTPSTGIDRAVWSDILHIYPGNTTPLNVTFGAGNYFNGIEDVWLVGDMTDWILDNISSKDMTQETDGTFSWAGNVTANTHFKFSLTDTTGWGPNTENMKRGAWFIPVIDGQSVTTATTGNTVTFVPVNNGTVNNPVIDVNNAWNLGAAGYYEITLNPAARNFIVERPVTINTFTVTPPSVLYRGTNNTFAFTLNAVNQDLVKVIWEITETVNSATEFTDNVLFVAAGELNTSLTITAKAVNAANTSTVYATVALSPINVTEKGDITIQLDLTQADLAGTLVLVSPPASPITIYKTGAVNNSVTFTASTLVGATGYTWYVNGTNTGTGTTITLNAADYPVGSHTVRLTVMIAGVPWSMQDNLRVNVAVAP